MKKMVNKYDYNIFDQQDGIYISIGQDKNLRKDFGPFQTSRAAKQAAYKQWRAQSRSK